MRCGRLRNVVFILFLLRWTRILFYQLKGRGIFGSLSDLYIAVRRYLYGVFLRLPGVRTKVQTQVSESILKLERKLVPSGPGIERITTLPSQGWSEEEVRKKLHALAEMEHTRWEDGRVSGAVYHGGEELIRLQTEAFGKFTVSNPNHPDVFPGVRKMEAEVVAMVLSLFSAPVDAVGVTTSGGTLVPLDGTTMRSVVTAQAGGSATVYTTPLSTAAVATALATTNGLRIGST